MLAGRRCALRSCSRSSLGGGGGLQFIAAGRSPANLSLGVAESLHLARSRAEDRRPMLPRQLCLVHLAPRPLRDLRHHPIHGLPLSTVSPTLCSSETTFCKFPSSATETIPLALGRGGLCSEGRPGDRGANCQLASHKATHVPRGLGHGLASLTCVQVEALGHVPTYGLYTPVATPQRPTVYSYAPRPCHISHLRPAALLHYEYMPHVSHACMHGPRRPRCSCRSQAVSKPSVAWAAPAQENAPSSGEIVMGS